MLVDMLDVFGSSTMSSLNALKGINDFAESFVAFQPRCNECVGDR